MRSDAASPLVVALVMAAGYSRRFGDDDKRLARLASGQTLLAATVARARQAFAHIRVVIREEDEAARLGLADDVALIRVRQAHRGLGASMAEAVTSLGRDTATSNATAVAILLGDMPWISREALTALQQRATPDTILRPCHAGKPGHPVIFGRTLWPELEALSGASGAREVIRRHPCRYHEYDMADGGLFQDIDTPVDLSRGAL
ncbi:nucleotidyltransferase family protein [Halomonas aquamarina]|uniref:Nucleotidyltransferase family protein n=1 Tax=Vreelandella aquamarina TaxID=77097 RepID=A0ACC5VTL5_9GAMM|nr:nucleotidyltransferase family protein [Halomonas aquamarina]MBZ5487601.1 nucleotidyltransferase family protein [Halomonas aquamarina]